MRYKPRRAGGARQMPAKCQPHCCCKIKCKWSTRTLHAAQKTLSPPSLPNHSRPADLPRSSDGQAGARLAAPGRSCSSRHRLCRRRLLLAGRQLGRLLQDLQWQHGAIYRLYCELRGGWVEEGGGPGEGCQATEAGQQPQQRHLPGSASSQYRAGRPYKGTQMPHTGAPRPITAVGPTPRARPTL